MDSEDRSPGPARPGGSPMGVRGGWAAAALLAAAAGCSGGGAEPPRPAWSRGDRAIVVPATRDAELGWLEVSTSSPGGRDVWIVETGAPATVLGPAGPDRVEVSVPASAIRVVGGMDPPPNPSGQSITLEAKYLAPAGASAAAAR